MGGETMSAERTSAEVVKDLRYMKQRWAELGDNEYEDETLQEFRNQVEREAADLIERLTGENERLAAIKKSDDGAYEHVVGMWHAADEDASNLADQLQQIDAALPDCPTCGGKGMVPRNFSDTPCPDCDDGHVSPAQLAALWQAVHEYELYIEHQPELGHVSEAFDAGVDATFAELRAVKP